MPAFAISHRFAPVQSSKSSKTNKLMEFFEFAERERERDCFIFRCLRSARSLPNTSHWMRWTRYYAERRLISNLCENVHFSRKLSFPLSISLSIPFSMPFSIPLSIPLVTIDIVFSPESNASNDLMLSLLEELDNFAFSERSCDVLHSVKFTLWGSPLKNARFGRTKLHRAM